LDYLLKNIDNFRGKYVEVEGEYIVGFEESALCVGSNKERALWVDFDDFVYVCPLISSKTKMNLFGKEQAYKDMYNKTLILHGQIDVNEKGHLSHYKASIKNITLVILE